MGKNETDPTKRYEGLPGNVEYVEMPAAQQELLAKADMWKALTELFGELTRLAKAGRDTVESELGKQQLGKQPR